MERKIIFCSSLAIVLIAGALYLCSCKSVSEPIRIPMPPFGLDPLPYGKISRNYDRSVMFPESGILSLDEYNRLASSKIIECSSNYVVKVPLTHMLAGPPSYWVVDGTLVLSFIITDRRDEADVVLVLVNSKIHIENVVITFTPRPR